MYGHSIMMRKKVWMISSPTRSRSLKKEVSLKQGNMVVNTGSIPIQMHLPTNMLKITKVNIN